MFAMSSKGPPTGGPTDQPPSPGGPEYGAWIFAASLFALAGIVLVAVVVVLRRRSRSSPVPTHVHGIAHLQTGPPEALPAPKEIVEFANRTVMRLVEYGGTS